MSGTVTATVMNIIPPEFMSVTMSVVYCISSEALTPGAVTLNEFILGNLTSVMNNKFRNIFNSVGNPLGRQCNSPELENCHTGR
eukprot:4002813-Amphidinium_carterae.1